VLAPFDKILHEGHWIGLEVVALTAALAAANNISPDVKGVLVDEVTLLAAASGIMAGDVIVSINGAKTPDLVLFRTATKGVANSREAALAIIRGGAPVTVEVEGPDALGLAQMEAAQMILATATSPHAYYGPCDKCHTIAKTQVNTGQLAKDAGDVLTVVAPPIKWGATPPHRDRGKCTNCHKIL
jgi:membrane-associated protease RseP (regulator of RpoE activity)